MKMAFTAMSKHLFYFRDQISSYTLNKGYVPLNPFKIHDYFLNEAVQRDIIRCANDNLVKISDELWVFGAIANGVLDEIRLAKKLSIPIKYFEVKNSQEIVRIHKTRARFEDGLERFIEEL